MDSKWEPLFYDKYAGNHQHNNPATKDVTFENLFDKSEFEHEVGSKAAAIYNSSFKQYMSIPLTLDPAIYQTHIFYQVNNLDARVKSFFAVIMIHKENFLKLVEKDQDTIPNQSFLVSLCRYHHYYTTGRNIGEGNTQRSIRDNINASVKKVVTDVMKPVKYDPSKTPFPDPKYITLPLFNYQKSSIQWMVDKESGGGTDVQFDPVFESVKVGDVLYDAEQDSFVSASKKEKIRFYGGGIIDEVGLGKTLQMTTLALLNQADGLKYVRKEKDPNVLFSRATLILCPSQLCGQWKRELENTITKDYNLKILSILTKRHFDKYTYHDLLTADFIIVSYTFMANPAFVTKWEPWKNFHKSTRFEPATVKKIFNEKGADLVKNPIKSLATNNPLLPLIHWHRLVVDEFHEIYTNKKYVAIKNIISFLKASYKWCVTGTPFITDDSLYYMVDFLTDYKNKFGKKLMTHKSILDYLSTDSFRRNTKDSVLEEHTLPPLEEEVIWLKFSPTERMMYNAFLANQNNNKYSVYLRQLCCHPNLAAETKNALSSCKSMKDIEQMMIVHYEQEVANAQDRCAGLKKRIRVVKAKIKELEQKKKGGLLNKIFGKDKKKVDDSDSDSDYEYSKEDDMLLQLMLMNQDSLLLGFEAEDEGTGGNISMRIEDLQDTMVNLKDRLVVEQKNLEGKVTTCNFFKNVVARIRKMGTVNNKAPTDKADTEDKEEVKDKGKDKTDTKKIDKESTDSDNRDSENSDNESIDEEELNDVDFEEEDAESDDENEFADEEEGEEICGICLGDIGDDDIGVTKCGHIYCYECLKTVVQSSAVCPTCRMKIGVEDIFMLSYERFGKKAKEMNPDKQAMVDKIGTKLANLIFYIKEKGDHCIVFSQWDDLLKKVGRVLSDNGVKNVFCKGNVYQRDKAIREFNGDKSIKVIMLSSESAASGTNLTKASRVILLDPVYGEYKYRKDTESQAIGRAYRLGQKNKLKVVRFIIKDTVEDDIYTQNQLEDKKQKDQDEAIKKKQEAALGATKTANTAKE